LKLPRCLDCILDGTSVASGEISDNHHVLAPGDAQAGRDVAQSAPASRAMYSSTRAWLVRKPQLATPKVYREF